MAPSFTPSQAQVWHRVFSHEPLGLVHQALTSGLLDRACLWEGRDLLFAVLCQSPESPLLKASQWWGGEDNTRHTPLGRIEWETPRLATVLEHPQSLPEPVREEARLWVEVATALLQREEVDPLREVPVSPLALAGLPRPVSSLHLALAANLVPVAERMGQWAARHGRQEEFRKKLHEADEEGMTLLHRAAAAARPVLVHYLLGEGADPNAKDARDLPVLFYVRDPRTLDLLLEHGANLEERGAGRTVLEQWQALAQKHKDAPYPDLIKHLLEREGGDTPQSLEAAAWMWLEEASLRVSRVDPNKGTRVAAAWKHGWKTKMQPALAGRPLHALSRRVHKGPLRGEVGFAAQMGYRWLRSSQAMEVWPALLDDPRDAITPSPTPIRKDLTDWGLLALGAARHLATDISGSPGSTGASGELLKASQKGLAKALEDRAPAHEWEAHMLQAAQVLQRPKAAALWRDVSCALASHAQRIGLARGKDRGQEKADWSLAGAEKKMDFLLRALEAGAKLPCSGNQEVGATPLTALVSLTPVLFDHLQEEACLPLRRKWAAVTTAVLADTVLFDDFCAKEDKMDSSSLLFFVRKSYFSIAHSLDGFMDLLPATARQRVWEMHPRLEDLDPQAFVGVREAYMQERVPRANTIPRPRSRF